MSFSAPAFFPERRHTFRRFLMTPLFSFSQISGREVASEDDLDLTLPRFKKSGPPPQQPHGIKLWQLLGVLFVLFAGHYKLVESTMSNTVKDIRNEFALSNAHGSSRHDEAMRRVAALEAEKGAEATRMAQMEATDERQDRELIEIRLNQRAVMRKIGIVP